MRVGVIGAGLAGLGVTWHFLNGNREIDLVIFDKKGIGKGTSSIASLLMHPYPGKQARHAWKAHEAIASTKSLLAISKEAIGREIANASGILRIACQDGQKERFRQLADEKSDVEWWNEEQCSEYLGKKSDFPGMFISCGMTINTSLYMQGLWKACQALGARLEKKEIRSIKELDDFDHIVLAAGPGIAHFSESEKLPLNYVKGQILTCSCPKGLKGSVIGKGYISIGNDRHLCYVGSSYERSFKDDKPDLEIAKREIFPKAACYFKDFAFDVLNCASGIRVTNKKGHLPLLGKIGKGHWVMTGIASRGLLYHSYLANSLTRAILSDDENEIYPEVKL